MNRTALSASVCGASFHCQAKNKEKYIKDTAEEMNRCCMCYRCASLVYHHSVVRFSRDSPYTCLFQRVIFICDVRLVHVRVCESRLACAVCTHERMCEGGLAAHPRVTTFYMCVFV